MKDLTPRRDSRFAIAAGGTGGHVYPAIAVAQELAARHGGNQAVHFLTDARPMSRRAISQAGFDVDVLPMQHGFNRHGSFANVGVAANSVRSLFRAWRILGRVQPNVVVGFGAYVSLPVIAAARLRRLPLVVHEQNGFPGLANRVAVRLGARACVSLVDTPLSGAELTGNPVRRSIFDAVARAQQPPLVAVFGGSLGAGVLNDATCALYDRWRLRDDVAIYHVAGAAGYVATRARIDRQQRTTDRLDYTLVEYEHDMGSLYARSSLCVTRAGGTVAELSASGSASVLVPWTDATDDHQSANAKRFAHAGAAVVLAERDCDGPNLDRLVSELLADSARLEAMRQAARTLAHPDAAQRVADQVDHAASR